MKVFKLVGGIFFAVGLIMLAVTTYLYVSQTNFIAEAKTAQGEVIDLIRKTSTDDGTTSYTYAAVVRFQDDWSVTHEFVNRTSSNPPRYAKGQSVTLLYAPDNPSDAIIDDYWGRWAAVTIIGGLGAVFAAVGGGMLFWRLRKEHLKKWLRANGTPVTVDFQSVHLDTSLAVNGRHPYRVIAQGKNPFTGKLEDYESDALWVDPTEHLEGKTLKVYIDANKPSRHSLDVEWLTGQS